MHLGTTGVDTVSVKERTWSRFLYRLIGSEISLMSRYYDRLIQLSPMPADTGVLYENVDCPQKEICEKIDALSDVSAERDRRTAILLNGNFNYSNDIQGFLENLSPKLSRSSRVVVVAYNPYLAWLYRIANFLGLRTAPLPPTFLTFASLGHVSKLAGFEMVRYRSVGYFPWRLFGIGSFINSVMPSLPILRSLSLAMIITLRPVKPAREEGMLSIVIPARNERGNIEPALQRLPTHALGQKIEVIFVEGHSKDQTWEEILRVKEKYESPTLLIQAHKQTGKGKNDAVRLGFAKARGELLTILDADLTMPPELLGRFSEAWRSGLADFVNGSRLVYTMEGGAMRPLNLLGNIFFCKAISSVLGLRLSDTLCGTKLIEKHDYERIVRWRKDFGDFDPFGDFELIFGASLLGLGNVDIPIRYLARTYGTTQISRFTHGFMLLRMTLIGFFKVRMGRWI